MIGKKILLYNFGVAFFIIILSLFIIQGDSMLFAGKRPENLGVREGKFASCPSSPNCVSSFEEGDHFISPLSFEGDGEVFWEALRGVLDGMRSAQVVMEEKNYLHIEFTSGFFGFVDDVEFLLDDEKKVVHVRSASRLGYSDFGVNRKRVETIRMHLQSVMKKSP